MKLRILNSGSAGNCYIFDNGTDALVIEAGVRFNEVKQAMNFDISRINGCLVSHEHGDHSKYAIDFMDARIKVFGSKGTFDALSQKMKIDRYRDSSMINELQKGMQNIIGAFRVIPFDVQHDCAEPLGFLIFHPDMGTTLFATDTYYLKYTFKGLNNIMLECNYRDDILQSNVMKGNIQPFLLKRTIQSHMSYDTCIKTLKANDLTAVHNIVLIHLSSANSNASEFKKGVQDLTGKVVNVAEKGMTLNFGRTPF